MNDLLAYFQDRQLMDIALTRYLEFANSNDWYIGGHYGKLRLYLLTNRAFNSADPQPEAFVEACESVRKWPGVQHGGSLAPANDVFQVILEHGKGVVYNSKISLANLKHPSSAARSLVWLLPPLQIVKPNKRYPWMPVSKVLHIVCPELMPIWDWEYIWYKVMYGAFRNEYQQFCDDNSFEREENGSVFLRNYALWAAYYIQNGDRNFMEWFTEWMISYFADDISHYEMEARIPMLYATAFEFVAIGAAFLQLEN